MIEHPLSNIRTKTVLALSDNFGRFCVVSGIVSKKPRARRSLSKLFSVLVI
jgi:hypothetical protein